MFPRLRRASSFTSQSAKSNAVLYLPKSMGGEVDSIMGTNFAAHITEWSANLDLYG